MKDYTYIPERVQKIAQYALDNPNASTAQIALVFGVSKTTVDHDLYHRLENVRPEVADEVKAILKTRRTQR